MADLWSANEIESEAITTCVPVELVPSPIEAQYEGARRGKREGQGAVVSECAAAGERAARWCWLATKIQVFHTGCGEKGKKGKRAPHSSILHISYTCGLGWEGMEDRLRERVLAADA